MLLLLLQRPATPAVMAAGVCDVTDGGVLRLPPVPPLALAPQLSGNGLFVVAVVIVVAVSSVASRCRRDSCKHASHERSPSPLLLQSWQKSPPQGRQWWRRRNSPNCLAHAVQSARESSLTQCARPASLSLSLASDDADALRSGTADMAPLTTERQLGQSSFSAPTPGRTAAEIHEARLAAPSPLVAAREGSLGGLPSTTPESLPAPRCVRLTITSSRMCRGTGGGAVWVILRARQLRRFRNLTPQNTGPSMQLGACCNA
jgi:hypothetical protein